jgi:outer membrane lipoprotein LolB
MTLLMRISLLLLALMLTHGCSTQQSQLTEQQKYQTIKQRNEKLSQINDWQFNGKIAFIQSDKRESASIWWQYQQENSRQKIDLTSYLGINILHLESNKNIYTLEVGGESYQSSDLNEMIYSLTGLILPVDALTYWLRGLAYNSNDTISYHIDSKLPLMLTSEYNNQHWQITYANYRRVNDVQLATKLTIKQNDQLIKILVKKWTL